MSELKYNRFLILENDIEAQGLPDIIQDILANNKSVPYEIWWWFGGELRNQPESAMKKFMSLPKDVLLLTNPSFIGYSNTFEGYLYWFGKLKEVGLAVTVGVVYYPSFYWYLIKWLSDTGSSVDRKKKKAPYIQKLKDCISYHEIYCIDYMDASFGDIPFADCLKRITWEWLEENYIEEGSKVRVKSTGKLIKVSSVYIREHDLEKSCVTTWEPAGNGRVANKEYRLNEIEKLSPSPASK